MKWSNFWGVDFWNIILSLVKQKQSSKSKSKAANLPNTKPNTKQIFRQKSLFTDQICVGGVLFITSPHYLQYGQRCSNMYCMTWSCVWVSVCRSTMINGHVESCWFGDPSRRNLGTLSCALQFLARCDFYAVHSASLVPWRITKCSTSRSHWSLAGDGWFILDNRPKGKHWQHCSST